LTGHGEKLSRKCESAIAALLQHGSIGDAAQAASISESTLRRWLKEPGFAKTYDAAKREMLDNTLNALRSMSNDAARTLHRIALNERAPAHARVTAAKSVIELVLRIDVDQALAERLDKLEEVMKEER